MFEIKAIVMGLLIGALLSRIRHLINTSWRSNLVFIVLESTQVVCLRRMDHIIVYFVVFNCIDCYRAPVLIFNFLNELHLRCVFLLVCSRSFLYSWRLLRLPRGFSHMHASIDISRFRKLFGRKRFRSDFFRTFVDNSIWQFTLNRACDLNIITRASDW